MKTATLLKKLPVPVQPIHDRVLIFELPYDGRVIISGGLSGGTAPIRQHPECVDVIEENGLSVNHDDYRRAFLRGLVLAVGPGKLDEKFKFKATSVRRGQVVRFSSWQDWDSAPPGYYMVQEADIAGVLE